MKDGFLFILVIKKIKQHCKIIIQKQHSIYLNETKNISNTEQYLATEFLTLIKIQSCLYSPQKTEKVFTLISKTCLKRRNEHSFKLLTGILSETPPILKFIVDLTVWAP